MFTCGENVKQQTREQSEDKHKEAQDAETRCDTPLQFSQDPLIFHNPTERGSVPQPPSFINQSSSKIKTVLQMWIIKHQISLI